MKIRIGMIGLGTVGSGVLELLDRHADFFRSDLGFEFQVAALCSRSQGRRERFAGRAPLVSGNPLELANHPDFDLLVEVAGGEDSPKPWMEAAFAAGQHVVTAT